MVIPWKETRESPGMAIPRARMIKDSNKIKYLRCFKVCPIGSLICFRKKNRITRQMKQAGKLAFKMARLIMQTRKNLHRGSRQYRLELPGLNIKGFKVAMGGCLL
jgi:hypothetical protein